MRNPYQNLFFPKSVVTICQEVVVNNYKKRVLGSNIHCDSSSYHRFVLYEDADLIN